MKKVTIMTAKQILIGEFLRERGYVLLNNTGHVVHSIDECHHEFGITFPEKKDQRNIFQRLFSPKKQYTWSLGRLHFTVGGEIAVDKWVLDVYGDRMMSQATELAHLLANEFSINIEVMLVSQAYSVDAIHAVFEVDMT